MFSQSVSSQSSAKQAGSAIARKRSRIPARAVTILAAVFALLAGLIATSPAYASGDVQPQAANGTPLFNQTFTDATLDPTSPVIKPATPGTTVNKVCLTASGDLAETPIPGCRNPALDTPGNGVLRLTDVSRQ